MYNNKSKKNKRTMRSQYENRKSKIIKGNNNKTMKSISKKPNDKQKSHIVKLFLEMLNMVKLYHWKTHSYAQHKATDDLYSKLNEQIDNFVEILLGKDESRIKTIEKKIELVDFKKVGDFKSRVYDYREFLIDLNMYFDSRRDSDLLNIRDEILGSINQFLYLLTFDK
jgi:DNA-binding ferritin-like protein